jgi:hypothetical protein
MEKVWKRAGICLILIFATTFLLSFVAAYEEDYGRVYQTGYNQVNHHSHINNCDYGTRCYYDKYHSSYNRHNRENVNTIHYSQYGTQESKKSFFGDYVKTYSVNVKNRGFTGRYFTVVFNFEDKNGYEFSESVTQYLRDGESKKFVYKDIQYERHEILDWDYKIIARRY